jgi:hypothetical protein
MQIIHENEYERAQIKFGHLFDICSPKPEMIEKNMDWIVRDGFSQFGTLAVGDLRVIKHTTSVLEIHPFPEWVVQCYVPGKKSGKVYALIPILLEKDVRKIERTPWAQRIDIIQKLLDPLIEKDFLAIEYVIGIDIKIPANIPHDFISIVDQGEEIPYCQVFEPNINGIVEKLRIESPFFKLRNEIAPKP